MKFVKYSDDILTIEMSPDELFVLGNCVDAVHQEYDILDPYSVDTPIEDIIQVSNDLSKIIDEYDPSVEKGV